MVDTDETGADADTGPSNIMTPAKSPERIAHTEDLRHQSANAPKEPAPTPPIKIKALPTSVPASDAGAIQTSRVNAQNLQASPAAASLSEALAPSAIPVAAETCGQIGRTAQQFRSCNLFSHWSGPDDDPWKQPGRLNPRRSRRRSSRYRLAGKLQVFIFAYS